MKPEQPAQLQLDSIPPEGCKKKTRSVPMLLPDVAVSQSLNSQQGRVIGYSAWRQCWQVLLSEVYGWD